MSSPWREELDEYCFPCRCRVPVLWGELQRICCRKEAEQQQLRHQGHDEGVARSSVGDFSPIL